MFSLIYTWINDWVNNDEAGDLRRYPAHYDVTVMQIAIIIGIKWLDFPIQFAPFASFFIYWKLLEMLFDNFNAKR